MIGQLPSISEAVSQIRRGKLRPLDLVELCLRRIAEHDGATQAWVLVDEQGARRQAQQLEATYDRRSTRCPPLLGVPVGIKDIVDVQGLPTRGAWPGSPETAAERDAPVVRRLREAGAVILGKTVTTQLACFDPPPTRNPWNPRHTPGGSSSGSAAAVALRMCLGALGSQTGGSITRPASYCGVCGLKPAFGSLPMDGVLPISEYLDHVGPLAATVQDLRQWWRALRPEEHPVELAGPPQLAFVAECEALWDDDVALVTRQALGRLRQRGAALVELALPELFGEVLVQHRRLMAVGAATTYGDVWRERPDWFGDCIAALIREGLDVPAVEFSRALRGQQQFRQLLQRTLPPYLTLVSPATLTPAPPSLETTGDPRFNSPWSFSGLPTCTLPAGLSRGGLPCGLQLIGNCGHQELLARAAWCETALEFAGRPPSA
ncbi:MAG: amidase [Pirellulaceae bacterium]|nr:amidase [Pirellulaceae bacterium]